jgi:acyl-coenzyme A thioesterase PaaI-like protein
MKRDFKATAGVRFWAFRKVFLLYFTKPSVLEVNERRCEVRIPLNWRTRNHLRSMYFGALCIGADVAGGLICFHLMSAMKVHLSFVFKSIRAEFLKRPEDDVHFSCEDGEAIQALVRRAVESGQREETTVHVTATVPTKLGDEPVAQFAMTLSVKKSGAA